jgi:hypothetical protein
MYLPNTIDVLGKLKIDKEDLALDNCKVHKNRR